MYLIIIDQGHLSLLDVLFEVVIKGQGLKLCPSQNRSDGYNNYENDVDDVDDDLDKVEKEDDDDDGDLDKEKKEDDDDDLIWVTSSRESSRVWRAATQ